MVKVRTPEDLGANLTVEERRAQILQPPSVEAHRVRTPDFSGEGRELGEVRLQLANRRDDIKQSRLDPRNSGLGAQGNQGLGPNRESDLIVRRNRNLQIAALGGGLLIVGGILLLSGLLPAAAVSALWLGMGGTAIVGLLDLLHAGMNQLAINNIRRKNRGKR